jgi:EAL domain-containing protein (putative c-di-GMP-specific phosphodiesterase class I)
LHRVHHIVTSIQDDLSRPVSLGPDVAQRVIVSASVGIAYPGIGETGSLASDLLRDADVAMFEAKAGGRARATVFGPAMRERAVERLRLTTDLRGAAERNEFVLAREPIVRLRDGAHVGCEALIRWQHPRLGMLSPGKFLPIAEKSDAIVQIGRWVLDSTIQGLATSRDRFVHVNLTVADLMEETLLHAVSGLLERHCVEPCSLAVEITEGSLVRSGGQAELMLERLRVLGIRIWIDDFGVEYSSLRYLDRLPVDGVKIDRSFVRGEDGNLASPSIVKMILDLAKSLDLDVIAEGIETTRQRDELLQLGCAYGQGYLFLRGNSPDIQTADQECAARS